LIYQQFIRSFKELRQAAPIFNLQFSIFRFIRVRIAHLQRVSNMFGFQRIIEKRIQEALDRGDFDDLPGRGKPMQIEDDSGVPEDLRLAYKVLKNADCLPPELQLKKEIRQMEDLLESIPDEKEKYRQIKKINYKIMRLNIMGKKSPLLEEREIYYKKLVEKFGQK